MTEPVERIARLGPGGQGIGIVTLPTRPRQELPALLLLNAGVVHRIGPHRLNVKLARALAQDGFASIRIDLSGLGDSPAAAEPGHSGEQALRDLRAAMAHMEDTLGLRRFLVFGLCSGAVNGYRLALADERVAGLVMFDGYVYPTWKTHLRRRLARFHALPWPVIAAKAWQWATSRREPVPPERVEGGGDVHLGIPSRATFAQAMERLVRRGTAVYLVYSGSFLEGHNYTGQLRDAFGRAYFLDRVRYDFMPDVDHTVTPLAAQRKVIAAVRDWAQSICAEPGPARTPAAPARAVAAGSTGSSIQESVSPP